MADLENKEIPLLQVDTSVKNEEEDLDKSRERDTTDDECYAEVKDDFSHLEQPGHSSDHLSNDDRSQNHPNSVVATLLRKGKDALSYFAGEILTSSEDSSKVSSSENSVDLGLVMEIKTDDDGYADYVDIDFDDTISEEHVAKLMNKQRLNHCTAVSSVEDFTISKCKSLFERDYHCEVLKNSGGSLSVHYPARLIIPVAQKSTSASPERLDAVDFDPDEYYRKLETSVHSRLMTRFVAPVIFFDKKFICRSGSLTNRKTATLEAARQKEVPKGLQVESSFILQTTKNLANSVFGLVNRSYRAASQLFFPNSMEKLRDADAEILRDLNIEHICDLMVEDRKTFLQALRICSSEKINRGIYKDCAIEQMPYPGCDFFDRYHEAKHIPNGLVFDWKSPEVNAVMKFSVDPYEIFPDINWTSYKEWDLIDLTRNYFKMMLSYLAKDAGGMLIHCISGWDRTPLFISMLRISLWADGIIHESLDYRDMVYLTLAYDWYLFGHNLPDRLNKKQEILHFCFNFLDYIVSDEFSLSRIFHELPDDEKKGRVFPEYVPDRRKILVEFRAYFLDAYTEHITEKLN